MTGEAMGDEKAMEEHPPITEQCVATARSTGERCKNSAIDGGNVCRFHGGATEHIKESADERLERMAAETLKMSEPRLNDLIDKYDEASDPGEMVKMLREIRQWTTDMLDRSDNGPSETHEHTGEDGGPLTVRSEVVEVTSDE